MTELERIEFDFMKAQLTAALSRIAALESAPSSGGGGGDGGVARQPEYIDLDTDYPVKPFTIERDDTSSTDGNYKMYVPDGCVLYDGVAVSVSGKGSDDWLDLGTTEGVTYYLHVTESSGTKSASIDTSSSASGHLATVKVATIATDDESSQQFLFSAINFGGSGSSEVIEPFTVRWCDSDSAWEVYIPASAVDLASYTVLMASATESGWYLVQGVGSSSQFRVEAHIKEFVYPGTSSVPSTSASPSNVVTVTAWDNSGSNTYVAADRAGDVKTLSLANCTVTTTTDSDGNSTTTRTCSQLWRGQAFVEAKTKGVAECEWMTATTAQTADQTKPTFTAFVNQCSVYSRTTAALSIGSATGLWWTLDCSTTSQTPAFATTQPSVATTAWVKVYSLTDGCITEDTRGDASQWNLYP